MKNIKDTLRRYYHRQDDLQRLYNLLDKEMELYYDATQRSIKAQHLSDMPRGSGTSDPVLDLVERLIDEHRVEIDRIRDKITEINTEAKWIEAALEDELNDTERRVIQMKYIDREYNCKIAAVFYTNEKTIQRWLQEAENKIKSKIA
jgi:DNA-directed RNA polymerase specialized sigma24 family protein